MLRMFSMCVDLCVGVPFKWRNLDTFPNTVDVRLVAVLISAAFLLLPVWLPLLTGFGLRNIASVLSSCLPLFSLIGIGDVFRRSSISIWALFGDALRFFDESLRLFIDRFEVELVDLEFKQSKEFWKLIYLHHRQWRLWRFLFCIVTDRSWFIQATTFSNAASVQCQSSQFLSICTVMACVFRFQESILENLLIKKKTVSFNLSKRISNTKHRTRK